MTTASTIGKGERVRCTLTGWGRLGEALAEVEGIPLFVFGGIPGEEVVVEVVRRHRRYLAGRVVEVARPSPHRVPAPCSYFGACTGCQWQHMDYGYQLEVKREAVAEALERIGQIEGAAVSPTLPSPSLWGYRNHARFTVGLDARLAYVNRETGEFVGVDECMLMHPWINRALRHLQGKCGETTQVSVRYGVNSGEWLIQPQLTNPDVALETGQKCYRERVHGRDLRIASPSFFQVNTAQAEQMVDLVRERLGLTGREFVVDAYAGVGTFTVLLAPHAGRVVAIEESASAVRDARHNAGGLDNVEFLLGKTEDVLGELEERPDAVVLDPPRVGCHPRVLEALNRLAPERVVYVSCDPGTLARDLRALMAGAFRLEEVQPLDMFPQTHHVECVATLRLKAEVRQSRQRTLVLASGSPRRRDILKDMGLEFRVRVPSWAEDGAQGATPEERAEAQALAKAQEVVQQEGEGIVVGADTVVVDGGEELGKPRDPGEAEAMLRRLRGRAHTVVTGVAVIDAATGRQALGHAVSRVTMRTYGDAEIQTFVNAGGSVGKAGAYAIQDPVFRPVERWEGCYLNVVGLSPCTLVRLLRELGVEVRPRSGWRPPEECQDCWLRGEEG